MPLYQTENALGDYIGADVEIPRVLGPEGQSFLREAVLGNMRVRGGQDLLLGRAKWTGGLGVVVGVVEAGPGGWMLSLRCCAGRTLWKDGPSRAAGAGEVPALALGDDGRAARLPSMQVPE